MNRDSAPAGYSDQMLELRSVAAASLRPSAFPADREKLMQVAWDQEAPEAILRLLQRLPEEGTWHSLEDVWDEAGGPGGRRP